MVDQKKTPIIGGYLDDLTDYPIFVIKVAHGAWITDCCYVIGQRSVEDALDEAADKGYLDSQLVDFDDLDQEAKEIYEKGDTIPDTWHLGNASDMYWSQDTYVEELDLDSDTIMGAISDALLKEKQGHNALHSATQIIRKLLQALEAHILESAQEHGVEVEQYCPCTECEIAEAKAFLALQPERGQ